MSMLLQNHIPHSTEITVTDSTSLAQIRWMRASMVTTLTDKAPSVFLFCCPCYYGKTLYDEMELKIQLL